jgi:hypothetical protein
MKRFFKLLVTFLRELAYPEMWFHNSKYDEVLDAVLTEKLQNCDSSCWEVYPSYGASEYSVRVEFCGEDYWVYRWRENFSLFNTDKRPSRRTIRLFMKTLQDQVNMQDYKPIKG